MRRIALIVAPMLVLATGATFAQTPEQPTPPGQTPPQQPPKPAPPATPAPPPPATPRPFPEGAQVAYVVLQRVASESAEGKAAEARLRGLQQKRAAELAEKEKALTALNQKLEKEGSVLSETARADIQKQMERGKVDYDRAEQDANRELQELDGQLQQELVRKVQPVVAQVGEEKKLQMIFVAPGGGFIWANPGLDVTAEVIKKLDAAPKAPAPATPPPTTKPPGR